jgi:hypothetical protein
MSKIIAGRFDEAQQMQRALQALAQRGFDESEYASYYVGPPGQHHLTPVGGDAHSSEGTKKSGQGAAYGAVGGGALGLALGSLAGPLGAFAGAGVGAYVGSLYGAMIKARQSNKVDATPEQPAERAAGAMVAVRADRPGAEEEAIAILDSSGAREIERTEGEWRDGDWSDFDPRVPTETVKKTGGASEGETGEPKQTTL